MGRRGSHALFAAAAVSAMLLAGAPAHGQLAREPGAGARAAGFADAVRSVAVGHTALYFNPAGMSMMPAYEIQIGYTYSNVLPTHGGTASIVDSATNGYVAAGFGYTFSSAEGLPGFPDSRLGHQLRGALSTGYRGETFGGFIGMGVRWLRVSLDDEDGEDFVTMDAGGIVTIMNLVRIGVVGQNLIDHPARADLPTLIGTGASVIYNAFAAAFDATIDLDSHVDPTAMYAVGLQYTVMDMLPLRAGFQFDEIRDDKRITAGLGYWSTSVAVDIGYQQSVESSDRFLIGLDIRVMIP